MHDDLDAFVKEMDVYGYEVVLDRPSPYLPPPAYARQRGDSVVIPTMTVDGQPVTVMIGWEAAQQVLADTRFTVVKPGTTAMPGSLLCDGIDHARLRRLLARGMSARTLEAIRPRMDELSDDLVGQMLAGGQPADLMNDVARPLALLMITELLGIEVRDHERFRAWAEAMSGLTAADIAEYAAAWEQFMAYVRELIVTKRAQHGSGLLSSLIEARDTEDGRIEDEELVTIAATLLTGGFLSTSNSLGLGVIKLVETGRLGNITDRDAAAHAVEEMLRLQAGLPSEAFPRWATTDIEVAGHHFAAGDIVLVRFEGANRDPDRFADPEGFELLRAPNPHLRFGHGPHLCIGAALARIVLTSAIRAIAEHVPGLALVRAPEDIPWTGHILDDGPAVIEVTWDGAPASAGGTERRSSDGR